jgi:hypothetical protein
MTSPLLQSLSLAFGLAANDPAIAEHFPLWRDYAWIEASAAACQTASTDPCAKVRGRWDWKRDQWFDLTVSRSPGTQTIELELSLQNHDEKDRDQVCITAIFLATEWHPVLVFHQSWLATPHRVINLSFRVDATSQWASVDRVLVGSKQCRNGPLEDRDIYIDAASQTGQARVELVE